MPMTLPLPTSTMTIVIPETHISLIPPGLTKTPYLPNFYTFVHNDAQLKIMTTNLVLSDV